MKKIGMLLSLLCLLFLTACGEATLADGTWTEMENQAFDFYQATGVSESEEPFDTDLFRFDLNGDPDYSYHPKGWLDENTVLCTRREKASLDGPTELAAVTLDGTVTKLDADIDAYTMVAVQDGVVAYGGLYETVLPDGVTFARWDGDETLEPVYQFQDGDALSFQQFFSPDGTKAVLPWCPQVPSADWTVRLIDLSIGQAQDLTLPAWSEQDAIHVLYARWLDDSTLQITAVTPEEEETVTWQYALP